MESIVRYIQNISSVAIQNSFERLNSSDLNSLSTNLKYWPIDVIPLSSNLKYCPHELNSFSSHLISNTALEM